ncbi:acyl dehydratase [Leucobacter sp. OH2974_COT-288]|nr:acyl dehydratase [Leucobacter sp. OH2974_COT-288]
MHTPDFNALAVGDVVATTSYTFTRDSLVRYAGASGDFNPIHYRDDIAASVGLEGVLAHGMLTLGAATSPVVEWLGGAGFVLDTQARFTRPVVVDPHTGVEVTVTATVAALDSEQRTAQLNLNVVYAEKTVLAKAQMLVQFRPEAA